MVHYRTFRNTDPPVLMQVWNEVFAGRGGVRLLHSSPLEQFVFSKPYFDRAGLILAEEDGICVGFSHSALKPIEEGENPDRQGAVCLLGVRPAYRRRGIGSKLLEMGEAFLRDRAAGEIYAGPFLAMCPFYMGLYGGSSLPGVLPVLTEAEPFLNRHGYQVCGETLVCRRSVREPLRLLDPRVGSYRQQFELKVAARKCLGSRWQEGALGALDPLEFSLEAKNGGEKVAWVLAWEMEGFGGTSALPPVGFLDLGVKENWRRQGLGKFFLNALFRALSDQYFETVELQVNAADATAAAFCRAVGFQVTEKGRAFKKAPKE